MNIGLENTSPKWLSVFDLHRRAVRAIIIFFFLCFEVTVVWEAMPWLMKQSVSEKVMYIDCLIGWSVYLGSAY